MMQVGLQGGKDEQDEWNQERDENAARGKYVNMLEELRRKQARHWKTGCSRLWMEITSR